MPADKPNTDAVPVSAAELITPLEVLSYVKVSVVGVVSITQVPSMVELPFVPDTVTLSPTTNP